MPAAVAWSDPHDEVGPPVPPSEPGARLFVWGVWGVMSLAAFGFVGRYGTNVPVWDDYHIVVPLIGVRPVTLGWLWEQCNEHRIAIPKLILLGADRLAGNDVRAGMFLSVALVVGLAAALIRRAERLPGGGQFAIALFPLLLLNLGHSTNMLWSFQLGVFLPTALATWFLGAIVARPTWPGPGMAMLVGAGMAILSLCGGTGICFVPALAIWLVGAAWAELMTHRPRRPGRVGCLVLAPLPGLILTALYFRGLRGNHHPEAEGGLVAGLRAGVQFLTGGLGMPTSLAWPWSGGVTLALVALAIVWLLRAWVRRPEERARLFGLGAFLAGVLALGAAVGWGRGWAGELAGFQGRYVTMATPLWCWLAFVFLLYAPPACGRLGLNTLFATLCVLLWPNTQAGLELGREQLRQAESLTRDMRSGMPPFQVIKQYTPYLHPDQDVMARVLPRLHDAHFGAFQFLGEDPPLHPTPLAVRPTSVRLIQWEGGMAKVTGVDPKMVYVLPEPRYVAGIRIKYSHSNRQGAPARFQLSWSRPGQPRTDAERPTRQFTNWNLPTGDGRETTVWVDDVIDRFEIQPDNQPCTFRIDELTLLSPSNSKPLRAGGR